MSIGKKKATVIFISANIQTAWQGNPKPFFLLAEGI